MTAITPTTTVRMLDFNGDPQPIKLITLTAWAVALRSEAEGFQVSARLVEPLARDFLSTPDDYSLADISDHVSESLRDVQLQLGIGPVSP